jgi:hypothetical protein
VRRGRVVFALEAIRMSAQDAVENGHLRQSRQQDRTMSSWKTVNSAGPKQSPGVE